MNPIKITDDKKGKWQSVKAEFTFEWISGNGSYLQITVMGYGADEAEAVSDFEWERSTLIAKAGKVFDALSQSPVGPAPRLQHIWKNGICRRCNLSQVYVIQGPGSARCQG